MLKIEQIKDSGRWYITLNGECIHGGIYSKDEAIIYLKGYQKIWDAAYQYQFPKDEKRMKEINGSIRKKPNPPPPPPMRKYKSSFFGFVDVLVNQDEIDAHRAMMDKWREENLK